MYVIQIVNTVSEELSLAASISQSSFLIPISCLISYPEGILTWGTKQTADVVSQARPFPFCSANPVCSAAYWKQSALWNGKGLACKTTVDDSLACSKAFTTIQFLIGYSKLRAGSAGIRIMYKVKLNELTKKPCILKPCPQISNFFVHRRVL